MLLYLCLRFASLRAFQTRNKKKITFLSGVSAAPFLEQEILPVLKKIKNLDVTIIPVKNNFYGENVTVTGLLSGQDFASAVQENSVTDTVLIPSKCLNTDYLFLDDWTVEMFEQVTGCSVVLMDDFLVGLPEFLKEE